MGTRVEIRSRVTPAVGSTMAMRRPASQLNSDDLPTFGRPTIATRGMVTVFSESSLGCRLSLRRISRLSQRCHQVENGAQLSQAHTETIEKFLQSEVVIQPVLVFVVESIC